MISSIPLVIINNYKLTRRLVHDIHALEGGGLSLAYALLQSKNPRGMSN